MWFDRGAKETKCFTKCLGHRGALNHLRYRSKVCPPLQSCFCFVLFCFGSDVFGGLLCFPPFALIPASHTVSYPLIKSGRGLVRRNALGKLPGAKTLSVGRIFVWACTKAII